MGLPELAKIALLPGTPLMQVNDPGILGLTDRAFSFFIRS